MKSKRRPIEIFTEICRVKDDAEGYVLCCKAFDCCAISIADIPLASNRLVLHVRCKDAVLQRLLVPAAGEMSPFRPLRSSWPGPIRFNARAQFFGADRHIHECRYNGRHLLGLPRHCRDARTSGRDLTRVLHPSVTLMESE